MLHLKVKYIPDVFWTPNKLNSYNISLRCVMSARSDGKTTNVMIDTINKYNKNKYEFVYVKRYGTQTVLSKDLLDSVICEKVVVKGDKNDGCEYIVNKQRVGYCLPLSKQANYKSGLDFSKVTTLIYDEFTIDREDRSQRYLKNEMHSLLNLISTVFRQRKNYVIWILGNNLDYINPFFEYFKIPDLKSGDIFVDKERDLIVQIPITSEKLKELKKDSPIGKWTKGTQFEKFYIDNELLVSHLYKYRKKRNADKLILRFIYNALLFNIYLSYGCFLYIEMCDKIIDDDYTLIIKKDNIINYEGIKNFKSLYKVYHKAIVKSFLENKNIEFDNKQCSHIFSEIVIRYLK